MPTDDSPQPADWSMLNEGDLVLVQVSNERTWTTATWDITTQADADVLVAASTNLSNPTRYAMILQPLLDMMRN